jgi:hypothetical protein
MIRDKFITYRKRSVKRFLKLKRRKERGSKLFPDLGDAVQIENIGDFF